MRRRHTRPGTAPTLIFLLMASTAPAPPGLQAQQTVELPAASRELAPELDHVFTVGSMEGADWEIFGELGGGSVAFDGEGRLYVFDRQNDRIVVVGPDGRFLREVGRKGEGPGEWRMPLAFSVLRDGTILVTDMGHRALLRYSPDGEYLGDTPIATEDGSFSFGGMQPDPRGGAVIMGGGGAISVTMRRGDGDGPRPPATRPVHRLGLADGARTTVYEAWKPPAPESDGSVSVAGGRIRLAGAMGPRRFEPGLHVGVLPDGGLAVVDSVTWTIKEVGSDGRVRRVLHRPFVPREVTRRLREEDVERRLEELESGEAPQMKVMLRGADGATTSLGGEQVREMQREQIRSQGFYPEIPVVEALKAGWGGALWVQRAPADPGDGPGPVDVVSRAGAYLGTVAPERMAMPAAFGPDGLVAHVERDEFDVPRVVVRRLPRELR